MWNKTSHRYWMACGRGGGICKITHKDQYIIMVRPLDCARGDNETTELACRYVLWNKME
ncbi:MAG: hypothetical protein AAF688_07275 [Bacteroidota bacterium]